MCNDHRDARVRLQIIRLRLGSQILHIREDAVNVCLQRIECVLEVVIVILLFSSLVVRLARHVKLFGRAWVIVL